METIRPLEADDLPAAWALERQVFNLAAKEHETSCDPDGADRHVGAFEAGRLIASCEFQRFGQFFAGRRIEMGGVASVAVTPEARGRGLASRMLRLLVDRMRAERMAISTLFPATPTLYRSLGWEFAGHWTLYAMQLERLRHVPRPDHARIRRATADDLEAIERLRTELSADHPGALDRGTWATRIHRRGFDDMYAYVHLDEAGAVSGALFYRHESRHKTLSAGTEDYDIDVRELFAENAEGLNALLWLLASSSTVAREAVYRGWPDEHHGWLVPELRPEVRLQARWMLRLLDVTAAIEARGGPPGMTAQVGFRVRDEMLPDNDDAFVVNVEGGEARVTRSCVDDPIELDIGALSALYSGHTSCDALARVGRLRGGRPATDWASLDAIFAGRAPAMVDDF